MTYPIITIAGLPKICEEWRKDLNILLADALRSAEVDNREKFVVSIIDGEVHCVEQSASGEQRVIVITITNAHFKGTELEVKNYLEATDARATQHWVLTNRVSYAVASFIQSVELQNQVAFGIAYVQCSSYHQSSNDAHTRVQYEKAMAV